MILSRKLLQLIGCTLMLSGSGGFSQGILPRVPTVIQQRELAFEIQNPPEGSAWHWMVLEPGGGHFLEGSNRYQAPQVEVTTDFTIQATDLNAPGRVLLTQVRVHPRAVELNPEGDQVPGGCSLGLFPVSHVSDSPQWIFEVVEPGGGQVTRVGQDYFYTSPSVVEPSLFHVRVRDAQHPEDETTEAIEVLPLVSGVSAESREMRAGQRGTIRMFWPQLDFEELQLGLKAHPPIGIATYLRPGVATFQAPHVVEPTQFLVTFTGKVGPWRLPAAEDEFLVLPNLVINANHKQLMEGNTCKLTVARRDGQPGRFVWHVPGQHPGPLPPEEPGHPECLFKAPEVNRLTTFCIAVTDVDHPGDQAMVRLRVWPCPPGMDPADGELILQTLLPHAMGPTWGVPEVIELAPGQAVPQGAAATEPIECPEQVRLLENDPAMGSLNGQWIVSGASGVRAVSREGHSTPIPGLPAELTAMAVRPANSSADNPLHLVFGTLDADGNGVIEALEPDGSRRILVGLHAEPVASPAPPALPFNDEGPGAGAELGTITNLVLAADGTVFFTEESDYRIRALHPSGRLYTLVDGGEVFGAHQLTLDPATGDLYWSYPQDCRIRKVDPHGGIHRLVDLGGESALPVPEDQRLWLGAMAIHGRTLYWTETVFDGVHVYDLQTGAMRSLIGPGFKWLCQPGPIQGYAPELSAAQCVNLFGIQGIGVSSDGVCLITASDRHFQVVLDNLELPEPGNP